MRRVLCFLLIIAIVCCIFGCGQQVNDPVKPASFYYCKKDITFNGNNDVFASETREIDGFEGLVATMNEYLSGPESQSLYSPFPTSVQILSIEEVGTTLNVLFSPQLSRLSSPDLMLACICTAKTLFDMAETETVIIRAEGVLLDGRESVMLTPERLVFTDNQPPESEQSQ